jgi:eukaryotic-like serine/threonine-protein kinase
MDGPRPGVLLAGRYRLLGMIGRGGMGEVWQATDEVLHRAVAIKTLSAGSTHKPDMAERFRREALAVARLAHRRVAEVFDYHDEGGFSFLVMELLDGETLYECLEREHTLPAQDAAEIVAQAAEGLQAAHDAGITHRDVKPANIMLTSHGVKLLDFGLAATTWDSGITSTGMLVGTLAYLAPERANGGAGTTAGDIYALGVVLYESLSGQTPFPADNPLALVRAHAEDVPPALPAGTPPALVTACLDALAKDPADRPPTATALAAAVRGTAPATPFATVRSAAAEAARNRSSDTARLTHQAVHGIPRGSGQPTADLSKLSVRADRHAPRTGRGVLVAVAAVAVLLAVILTWPRDPEPTGQGTGTGTEATDAPAGQKRAVAAALGTLLDDIDAAAGAGGIQADTAKDLTKRVKELRNQLVKGRDKDAVRRLDELNGKLRDGTADGSISREASGTLDTDLANLANALGLEPN